MIKEYLEKYNNKEISLRQLCYYANKYNNEIIKLTSFIDNADIYERLYCIINDISSIVKCKYCDNKATWSGRLQIGYRDTCDCKECRSKLLSDSHANKNIISNNRNNTFIEKQKDIVLVTDSIVKDLIKYDKYIDLITNENILNYIDNRFVDSSSRIETVQRIRLNIEEKPKCPTCGKPVKWVGKASKLYTTYCSNSCSAQNKETTVKKKATQLEHWGSENCYDSEKYKQHLKETIGVEYHTQREDIKEKRKESLIKHYGTTKLYKVEEIKDKIIATNREKFGCDCVFQNKDIREAAYKALLANGHGTSKAEDKIYSYFNYNIERFHHDDIFPFTVDFYDPMYNLYIEYQGSQFHNGKAFLGTKEDYEELKELEQKDRIQCEKTGKDKSQYRSIINTWSIYDVKKREYARDHHINYIEIYECNSAKDLEYQLGIWKYLYKRLDYTDKDLEKEYEYFRNLDEHELSDKPYIHNDIVKHFQFYNFFGHEIDLYINDPVIRRKLIQNRCKYLNKRESDLTIDELLTGFKKSGIYYGYSHFDPRWTNWFVNKFNLNSVYDPCGGWGHHLLGMLKCDKIIYNDFSESTVNAIEKMKDYFKINNLEVHYGNGTEYIPEEVDGWFMCPPYYNLEHYECDDFESLEDYKVFLNKIMNLWKESSSRVFGIIIREDLVNYIDVAYSEVRDIDVKNSHLSKKKIKERFYIYTK